jgi:hypothetical protein
MVSQIAALRKNGERLPRWSVLELGKPLRGLDFVRQSNLNRTVATFARFVGTAEFYLNGTFQAEKREWK